jgi:hypothetical protein
MVRMKLRLYLWEPTLTVFLEVQKVGWNIAVWRHHFLKLGCLHPVACIRSGSGVSLNLVIISVWACLNNSAIAQTLGYDTWLRHYCEDDHWEDRMTEWAQPAQNVALWLAIVCWAANSFWRRAVHHEVSEYVVGDFPWNAIQTVRHCCWKQLHIV